MKLACIKRLVMVVWAASLINLAVMPVQSHARPSTRSYTCPSLHNLIRQRGAVVLNYKGNHVYRRFVSSFRYCRYPDNMLRRFTVPTKTGSCRLYICYERRIFDW
jgi:hypothetical protein